MASGSKTIQVAQKLFCIVAQKSTENLPTSPFYLVKPKLIESETNIIKGNGVWFSQDKVYPFHFVEYENFTLYVHGDCKLI